MATSDSTSQTVNIPLTRDAVATIDDVDSDLSAWRWWASGNSTEPRMFYAQRTVTEEGKRRYIWLHRLILERMLGRSLSSGEVVDHIDGNTLNNCRSNLRLATHAENMRNRKVNRANICGYKGVSPRHGRYQARITAHGKQHFLGSFDTPEEAHEAYCKAARELHGDFARFE